MAEDGDAALDTAMYKEMGNSRRKVLIPVRIDEPEPQQIGDRTDSQLGSNLGPDEDMDNFDPVPIDIDVDPGNISTEPKSKRQWYYMKEFVSRVDGILEAMQAREALPETKMCSECGIVSGRWRCRDCASDRILCRACVRHSHFGNPFHRIERWTGTYFRKAALWEVGGYIAISHCKHASVCSNLQWQQNILEIMQKQKDQEDEQLEELSFQLKTTPMPPDSTEPEPAHDPDAEEIQDAATMRALDQLLNGQNPPNIPEEDDANQDDAEADLQDGDAGAPGFVNYIRDNRGPSTGHDYNLPMADHITPHAPGQDALNNEYVRVVHTNGIHYIALVFCSCQGKEEVINDLIYARLVPTSFTRIRTLFTTAVLDHFRFCNLELRASAYQFFQLLRRFTMPLSPSQVTNLYHELRRLSRLWRWVKKLRWAGYGQRRGDPINPLPGELSPFCTTCPQPGINLPKDWMEDQNRWVFRRVSTADGNFKADHVRQKNAADDMWLLDGSGMTARRSEYAAFLETARELRTVSRQIMIVSDSAGFANLSSLQKAPCENSFRAIEQAMLLSKACDITGIVGIACARHGCFAPNSIVDLTRGEQQKNVDWAFLESLRTTNVHPDQGVLLIYDIACQYFVHFHDRIGHLLPAGLEVDRAIGLFHVHGHKKECFYRFASSFIPGAGIVAGEILESLWAGLNTITPSTRTATHAHRAEVIDDHASDSNHKKALGMGKPFLCLPES
jgi:hypothetical protein